jgi:hypothetical protein
MLEEKVNNQQDIGATPAVGQMDRMIPKLCTNIQVALLNEKHIVLSMFYADNFQTMALIERITIDVEHAKGLIEILNKIVEEVK